MIRLEGLRVQAGDFSLAVDDLSIGRGEYAIVLGPTASGKTVLLETVAGLRRSREGRVWFGARDVTAEPPERRGAGLVYQDYALFPHLTVAANIAFGLRSRRARVCARPTTPSRPGVPSRPAVSGPPAGGPVAAAGGRPVAGRRGPPAEDNRVRELAVLLGIEGLLPRYPEGLSGGERQRVALARALAIGPEVLLLDEPLSALDGPTRAELQGELRRVQRELGATVMHVTHDLDEALALGDQVAVLIDGRLRQVGTPEEVTRFPADVEVARLVGFKNVFPISIPDEGDVLADDCRKRLLLENGWELLAEPTGPAGLTPRDSPGRLFAVVRADETGIESLDGRGSVSSLGWTDDHTNKPDNLLEGRVRLVQLQSVHASIEVEVPPVKRGASPAVFTVHVLRSHVERAGFAAGSSVRLRIPPSAVHVCPGAGGPARGNAAL